MTLAPVLFLLCTAAGAAVMARGQRDLTMEQKAALFDAAPKRQSLFIVTIALVMGAFTLFTLYGRPGRWSFVVFSGVMFVLLTVFTGAYVRRVSQSGAPPAYVRAVRFGMWILWVSSFLLYATLTIGMWTLFRR